MRTQQSDSVERAVMRVLCERLNPPTLNESDIDYVNTDFDPSRHLTFESARADYVTRSFLRKWKGLDTGLDLEQKAFDAWREAELLDFRTNSRLRSETTNVYSLAPRIISDAQRKISQILGEVNMEEIAERCRFGNGATFDLRRGSTHAEKSLKPSVTFDAIPTVCQILSGDDNLGSLVGGFNDIKIVDSNRMVMVPKSAKTHRPIAAEPTLNSFVQQGIGRTIRRRLKLFGVDLDDQTINQDLARKGQADGFATIDLSSASDTLCVNLVELLIPPMWFDLLDSVRCKYTTYKGKKYRLEKFSSMGNAYTFELESLIFYALVSSTCRSDVISVYGDDIIVSDSDYAEVVKTLTWAGFRINNDKSFTGNVRFRESCGKHFFDGKDITPCYQKEICRHPHDYVHLHNRLVRAGIRLDLRDEFNEAAQLVRDWCRRVFGKASTPGVGPLVEYDEYFIKEAFVWSDPLADRFLVKSALVKSSLRFNPKSDHHLAYYARKLRCPSFLNTSREGHVFEKKGSMLIVLDKYHWRSATK